MRRLIFRMAVRFFTDEEVIAMLMQRGYTKMTIEHEDGGVRFKTEAIGKARQI